MDLDNFQVRIEPPGNDLASRREAGAMVAPWIFRPELATSFVKRYQPLERNVAVDELRAVASVVAQCRRVIMVHEISDFVNPGEHLLAVQNFAAVAELWEATRCHTR